VNRLKDLQRERDQYKGQFEHLAGQFEQLKAEKTRFEKKDSKKLFFFASN
jgi:prefoldin subunit 5